MLKNILTTNSYSANLRLFVRIADSAGRGLEDFSDARKRETVVEGHISGKNIVSGHLASPAGRYDGAAMRSLVLVFSCFVSAAAVQAQGMTDPTQPPAAAPSPDAPGAQGPPLSRLRSVYLSRGRKAALIDGMTVPLGGKVGEATLVHVADGEVVLDTNGTRETLKLIPQVDKTPSKRAPARAGERPAR